ncbi:RNA recognition motif domain-containing protein [Celerinatantimonas diazotrophica]|uniref:RNA recognition motif-containing protein n=1 Tax=Celerinatantimonas diazotrophica TaxID=412034 RepID=A0A4R1K6E0_9GAMM|nr:RNA-binding protein [Celerinatantimonas diazotrophica]TCK59782.1 RNA recognition motif-containing protein [Celerinatantimonas diazotrophica]CAG9295536.1 hypothetical protein CEDIAZO_00652 [Celerinatantimonas diazotrophica]
MKTPLSLSIILTIVCAVVLAVLTALVGKNLSAPMAMSIGSIITGLVVAFVRPSPISPKSETSSSSESTQTLYVGNLPYRANETAVRELFAQYGHVVSVRLLKDKHTGKRRGFGFVEMTEQGALAAQKALNEQDFQHRTLKVRPANERKDHSQED